MSPGPTLSAQMTLAELLHGVAVVDFLEGAVAASSSPAPGASAGSTLLQQAVADVREDSRVVQAGDLFVAVPGQTVDGHAYVATAAERGAIAAVVEKRCAVAIPQIVVRSSAEALSLIAANRYGRPADSLKRVAVTGTNGKTTTTHLVEALFEAAGMPCGVIGSIAYRFGSMRWPAPLTTPTALLLHQTLAEMVAHGARAVAMEASSHALSLQRLSGLRYHVAAFMNLTQDHLDFHGDMETYFQAKLRLFHQHLLPPELGGRAVVLIDDEAGQRIAQSLPPAACLRVSLSAAADISLLQERQGLDGTQARFQTPLGELAISSRLTGRFNLANLAVAVGIGVALGLDKDTIARGLARIEGVPGRLERVALPKSAGAAPLTGPSVFVDYAHTPDALERVLGTLRVLGSPDAKRGRLFVVFGCGGDRDTSKRAPMGRIAASLADIVVVTSDNPRSEDPRAIVAHIVRGIVGDGTSAIPTVPERLERPALTTARSGYFVEVDRRQAISAALLSARPEDIVLIAGKGHEDYQIIGTQKQHFDDREEAQRVLSAAAASTAPRSGSPSSPLITTSAAVASHIELPLERVLQATSGKLLRGGAYRFTAVTIDSRAVLPGALFVAVRGQKQDGHQFCAQAVSAGAAGVLVDRGKAPRLPDAQPCAVIEVADTHVALGQIARAHREAPEIAGKLRVVGVTGSSGKTSTKELIAAILSTSAGDPAEVLKTEGNLNNHFGVPLTLLRLRPGQRFAVIEMGMSARGEIAYLTSLARPDVGVLTNVGPAHLETLGSLDHIAAAKGELFGGLLDGATAVFAANREHERVQRQAILAGATPPGRGGRLRAAVALRDDGEDAPLAASERGSEFVPVVRYRLLAQRKDGIDVELHCQTASLDGSPTEGPRRVVAQVPLLGMHQADNAALAAAAALALDVPPVLIAHGLQRVVQAKHRGQVIEVAGRYVLDDCYNANPASTAAALRTLTALRGSAQAVAVLGDMLELGPTEDALHAEIGEVAAGCGLAHLITVGSRARHTGQAAQAHGLSATHAESSQQAAALAAAHTRAGDWILIKGSRGMVLEQVLDHLRATLVPPLSTTAAGPAMPGDDAAH